METYTTVSGDTWDVIAKKVYGDELKADHLMQDRVNITLLDFQVFPAGVTIHVPDITDEQSYEDDLPEWRKE